MRVSFFSFFVVSFLRSLNNFRVIITSSSLSITLVSEPSKTLGLYAISSSKSYWYAETLRNACALHWLESNKHCNPNFLHQHKFSGISRCTSSSILLGGGLFFVPTIDDRISSLIIAVAGSTISNRPSLGVLFYSSTMLVIIN